MKISAAVLQEPGERFTIESIELTTDLGPRDVLVKVVATGLCHTDLAIRDGHMPSPFPVVLGHEGSGTVEAVGAAVTKVAPGDPVVLTPLSCHECANCVAGHPSYCERGMGLNLPGPRSDGSSAHHSCGGQAVSGRFFGQSSFAGYALAHETNVVRVANDLPIELLGPLGCGLQTGAGTVLNVLRPRVAESLAVFGTGPVGMAALMAAKASGCATIVAIDINDARLELAHSLGATHTINSRGTSASERISRILPGGVHYAVDTTGRSDAINEALSSLRAMGRCALVAIPSVATLDVEWPRLLAGRTLEFVPEGDSVPEILIPQLLALYRMGLFPFERLITFYELEDINQAVTDFEAGRTIKAVIRMPHR